MRKLLIVVLVAFSLTGCAGLGKALDGVVNAAGDNELLVRYSFARLIDGDVNRANEVIRVSRAVQEATAMWAYVTAEQLIQEADKHIPWQKLHPADAMLVRAFLPDLAASFVTEVEDLQLNPNEPMRLDAVFAWIEETALLSVNMTAGAP